MTNTDLMNEFYLLQASRSNEKYLENEDDHLYTPINDVNTYMSAWVTQRSTMLMRLERRLNISIRRMKSRYLKF